MGFAKLRRGIGNANAVALIAVAALVVIATAIAMGERTARADGTSAGAGDGAVALLPLDADASLELYGQPVANEVARALVAGGIEVVVVGAKVAMPARARLVVDGTIASGKGGTVILSLRIRDPRNGTTLDTLSSTAPTLANIDRATADLSAHVLPTVRARLAALDRTAPSSPPRSPDHVVPAHPTPELAAAPTTRAYLLATGGRAAPAFQTALAEAATRWSRRVGREPTRVSADALAPKLAPATVAQRGDDVGLAFEVRDFAIEPGKVPTAHATVRVRIADRTSVAFDRVVVTDTVVGSVGMTADAMTARVAEAVIEIVAPHVQRKVPAWSAP